MMMMMMMMKTEDNIVIPFFLHSRVKMIVSWRV